MVQGGILILLVFVAVAALMMTKKDPQLCCLPLMAILICHRRRSNVWKRW